MLQPQLCAVVTGRTMEEIRRGRDAVSRADLVELRLDYADRPDVAAALEGRRTPVVVTCRAEWEGGRFTGGEEERRRILESALEQGAEYIDVEAAAGFAADLIRSTGGRRIVLSEHDFDGVPSDVPERFEALRRTGAEIAKLAVRVDRLDEMIPLFDIARARGGTDNGHGHILIAMGNAGLASRILAARLGSRWTYAGDDVAPGQLTIGRLLQDFRFRRIAPDAALYAVVGNPIVHSRSPIMHNAGFAALGMNAVYLPLEARDADDFVRFARVTNLRGASVTTPYKLSLLPHLDEIEPLAARVGAINTLLVRDGRWIGANTDVDGFLEPLEGRMNPRGTQATVLGSGGAARAVAVALADRGAKVTISARRIEAAREIAEAVQGNVTEFPPRDRPWDLLVNATTAGSSANPGNPMAGARLSEGLVYDLVYSPLETELLKEAKARGCGTIGGIEMLIAQAERQFERWTGQRPPAGLFASAVEAGADRERQ
jgi:3-dehydroquinate dehydratase / shikimate dehydrogenase